MDAVGARCRGSPDLSCWEAFSNFNNIRRWRFMSQSASCDVWKEYRFILTMKKIYVYEIYNTFRRSVDISSLSFLSYSPIASQAMLQQYVIYSGRTVKFAVLVFPLIHNVCFPSGERRHNNNEKDTFRHILTSLQTRFRPRRNHVRTI